MENNEKKVGRPKKNEEEKAKKNERIICDICNKSYIRYNSYNHKKTKYHQNFNKIINTVKHLIHNYENAKSINDIIKEQYTDNKGNIIYLTDKQYNFYSQLQNKNFKLNKK